MAKATTGFHFRMPPELRARLDAVAAGVEIVGDSRRQTPHPKISQLIVAAAEYLCGRFERGESIVSLPALAALSASQVVLEDGKPTKRRHLAPIGTVELYAALAKSPRLLKPDEDRALALDAGRLATGPAFFRGKVFTDPTDEQELKTLVVCVILSIRAGTAQVAFNSTARHYSIHVFDLVPIHEAARQRHALSAS